jgi:hypothetical protein
VTFQAFVAIQRPPGRQAGSILGEARVNRSSPSFVT